jgi:hypothetical protein
MRLTEEQYQSIQARIRDQTHEAAVGRMNRPGKFRNKRVTHQGLKFDSGKECEDYKAFQLQRALGGIRGVARQVSIQIPGSGRRIRIDHMIVENDGTIRFFDSKGFDEAKGKLKRDLIRDSLGIDIQLC